MLLRRLALVLLILSLFSVGLSRRHGPMQHHRTEEAGVTDVPVTTTPPESTTTSQTGQSLTKHPSLHSNSTLVIGNHEENEIYSSKTHVPIKKATPKPNVSKPEIGGLTTPIPTVNGSKTEEVFKNKTKSNVGKNSTKDASDNHPMKVMPNLKLDKNITIFFNKSDIESAANKTGGGVGVAVPDDDISNTEVLNPDSKGVVDIVNTLLTFWGPGQGWMSLKQILFFHIFVISIYYLLVCIMQGFIVLINQLRTPLLIYKEVKDMKEVKPVPAPVLPPPHKEYGYEGGFKTPKGEPIKYVEYHDPKGGKAPEGPPKAGGGPPDKGLPKEGTKPEGPPKAVPLKAGPNQMGPPGAGNPAPPKMAFHEPPSLVHQQGPVVSMGGGGAGPQHMSSYTNYAGEAGPPPAWG